MLASKMNIVTLRETPNDAEISSHQLLLRAGYMHKSGSGLYVYGPLLHRVIKKISDIVAQEISRAGGLEITMPIMQDKALWEKSGRWAGFQKTQTMLTVTDRGGQEFGLAPTAEEVVTDYAAHVISSYKQLPVCFFQQHTKFRDEIRPRFGLMRVKEFVMMDAYSFHADEDSLEETYQDMRGAYDVIFKRCGLQAFAVEADSGAIGGSSSHEFMIGADVGEDSILLNAESGYAANVERADAGVAAMSAWVGSETLEKIHTENMGSIEDVCAYMQTHGHASLACDRVLKTVLLIAQTADQELSVAACVRGDRALNEIKLANCLTRISDHEILEMRLMTDDEVRAATSAEPGYASPATGLAVDFCIADTSVQDVGSLVAGANETNYHYTGFQLERDAVIAVHFENILLAQAGDACPLSGLPLIEKRGIEVGHIFKLGTTYSQRMGAVFNSNKGQRDTMTMGCYGIGTSRIAAAAIEQYHDENGITWPMPIAPYHCVILGTKKNDQAASAEVQRIYDALEAAGLECIIDDRKLGPGVKFKDWDLIGVPLRIVVGRCFDDGIIEVKQRCDAESTDVTCADVVTWAVDAWTIGMQTGD